MRNLLAIRNATRLQSQNITKQAKATRPDGCGLGNGQCIDIPSFGISLTGHGRFKDISSLLGGFFELKKGDCFCFDSSDGVSFIFSPNLRVEGNAVGGSYLGPVDHAWGASTGYFKVTLLEDLEPETFYSSNEVKLLDNILSIPGDLRNIAIFKDWEGTIKSEVDIQDKDRLQGDLTGEIVYALAPEVTVSFETDEMVYASWDGNNVSPGSNQQKGTVTTNRAYGFAAPTDVYNALTKLDPSLVDNKKYEAKASITVTLNDQTPWYPNKIFQMKPNMIFDNSVEEYEFLDGGGLSAGAIAGIVIACAVVVGVVVFCIVWFVVLKKGCCCGKGGKNSDAEA